MDLANNHVVALCVAGMRAEAAGQLAEARALYLRAWAACQDDVDACVAAHYLARQAEGLDELLHWNGEALRRAAAAGDGMLAWYPSLHLNLGYTYERVGDDAAAIACYERAHACLHALPPEQRDVGIARSITDKLARLR